MTQLAAVSCLSLAAKVEETQVPLLLDFQRDQRGEGGEGEGRTGEGDEGRTGEGGEGRTGEGDEGGEGDERQMGMEMEMRDDGDQMEMRGRDLERCERREAERDFTEKTKLRLLSNTPSMASQSDHKATVIDGKFIAQTIRSEIAEEVRQLSEKYGKVPGLAVVIVGNRKDSQSYVGMKRKACAEVGIRSFDMNLPEQISEAELVSKVHELNANPDVHGILVQLPLPKHINEEKVLKNLFFQPCTPKGCLELLHRSGISIKGKRAVVVGRSNIVGLPVSLLLLKADATVTVVHSRSNDQESIIREADIIIAAAGQPMMIKGSWIKPGAAVIDVGTNAVDDPSRKSGYRLVGDVDFEEACKIAGCITPVPGGVGPMTVAMLLKNTLDGAKRVIVQ
ncbi:hypothetical protein OIU78_024943 [Salix suchowensis]|nr:hypothetical protein OIU78_024943 [Salix suchowensis]